jgi:hypothetical protein
VPAPTAYVTVQATDQTYSVDQPVGWSNTSGSAEGVSSSSIFESGNAKIKVGSDLAGSLWGDIANAQSAQMQNMVSLAGVPQSSATTVPPAIEKVHMMGQQDVAKDYSNYSEQPMQTVESKLGEGRISEFTAQGGAFVGPMHGYRATFLSVDRRITVLTVCSERNWAILAPSFMHEIQSVNRGSG